MIAWIIPDLDLLKLSQWLADLKAGPVVALSLSATISSVRKSELEFSFFGWLHFNDSNDIIVIAEFFDSWEVSVLAAHNLATTRI